MIRRLSVLRIAECLNHESLSLSISSHIYIYTHSPLTPSLYIYIYILPPRHLHTLTQLNLPAKIHAVGAQW